MLEDHFGEDVAARYDETAGSMFDIQGLDLTVDVLAELAGGGAALEFAVGTGRVALPLADRGVPVSGIELSTAMADRLRDKDGGGRIDLTMGDMATSRPRHTTSSRTGPAHVRPGRRSATCGRPSWT